MSEEKNTPRVYAFDGASTRSHHCLGCGERIRHMEMVVDYGALGMKHEDCGFDEDAGVTDEQHVVPADDREHELASTCWCEPRQDQQEPRIWIHNYREVA